MNTVMNRQDAFPAETVDQLIARIGPWRIAAALAAHVLRRWHRPAPVVLDLPEHLRRDLGLPSLPVLPFGQRRDLHAARWTNPAVRW